MRPIDADFAAFWTAFPRKVGKLAAQKAYEKARQRGATQTQLLAGIATYVQCKPAYSDWCHPATWLNQGRWEDCWDNPVAPVDPGPHESLAWLEECLRLHGGACGCSLTKHLARKVAEAKP